ncbi:MAG: hypothetical protein IIU58_03405 [Clostridia bacterium]|nr:hypothetical protein [Clostridia bacterium]
MELKKMYSDLSVLIGKEIPIYAFLLYADMCAGTLLCRYPKKLLMPVGEYSAPVDISDAIPLSDLFYTALLYGIAGSACGNDSFLAKSDAAAEQAYRTLWRAHARGKRRKGDVW